MTGESQSGEKVEFSGSQADDSADKKLKSFKSSRRKIKIAIAVFGAILSLAVAATTLVYFLQERSSRPLAEVNLEEGDTMVYRIDQNLEVRVGGAQKGTTTAVVALRVINKTSEEYWFLMKVNITFKGGDVDVQGLKAVNSGFFLVKLQISLRTQSKAGENSWSDGTFELHGNTTTEVEFIRYVYGILYQLLPALGRDLYEDVDGKKDDPKKQRSPERSPLLPGDVKMHREASTFDRNQLYIKNHFNRSDLVNVSSEIDLDMTYVDYSSINKSNGMVSESHAYLSEQLYFGEAILTKSGSDVTMLNVTLVSHVSLIDTDSRFYFGYAETEGIAFHLFTKLTVPKSEVSVGDIREPEWSESLSNSSQTLANDSTNVAVQNVTRFQSSVPVTRRRRSSSSGTVNAAWRQAEPLYLSETIEKQFTAFSKKMIGITIKGYGKLWLTIDDPIEIGCSLHLKIGPFKRKLISKTFESTEIKEGKPIQSGFEWEISTSISVPVFILRLGVDFDMKFIVNTNLNFPSEKNSLNPVKFAVEVEPYAKTTASIVGYASAFIIRAGVSGEGTLLKLGFPITLSYDHGRSSGNRWCLDSSVTVNALELSARIFYQWRSWWRWGAMRTLYNFGKTDGISNNWQNPSICSL